MGVRRQVQLGRIGRREHAAGGTPGACKPAGSGRLRRRFSRLHGDLRRAGTARGDRRHLRYGGPFSTCSALPAPRRGSTSRCGCCCNAGDHAIVITPNYQAAETVPLDICEVTGVPLDIDRNWDLDVDLLRAALRPNTKLISINFPNNPTGKIISRSTFDAIVEICRSRGLWLFSDEVYRLIERDPALRLPQAVDVYERAISLNVMSKAYGLPGLRIGWLACKDRATLRQVRALQAFPVDMQLGAVRGARANCAQGAGPDPGAEPQGDSRQSRRSRTLFSRIMRICSSGASRMAAASVSSATRARTASKNSRAGWSRNRACFFCHRVFTDRNSGRCRTIACASDSGARMFRRASPRCADGSSSINSQQRHFFWEG